MPRLKKIMFVFGTRPEAIKMAPVISEIKKHKDIFEELVVVTGQHREMLDQVLNLFKIRPDYDLGIMEEEQTISSIVIKCLSGIEEIILHERPDFVLVQGDTSTTFAASLAAFYHRVPLGHIEAGLRTYNKFAPFPEEANRKLTSQLADLYFAPTKSAVHNLLEENISRGIIFLTGNTVIDTLLNVAKKNYEFKQVGLKVNPGRKIILLTAHRRESFGEPLKRICAAIKEISTTHPEVEIIVPVHKNPEVKKIVSEILGGLENVQLVEPLEYESFVHLMKASYLILTDSGGIQEEAPSLSKPVLVLREVTERPEAVEAKVVKVVGTRSEAIVEETEKLLADEAEYTKMARGINPYGDGKASERIIGILLHYFGFTDKLPEELEVSL